MAAPWTCSCFSVHEFAGEIEIRIYRQVRWVRLEDLEGYEFLAADRGLIKDLAAGEMRKAIHFLSVICLNRFEICATDKLCPLEIQLGMERNSVKIYVRGNGDIVKFFIQA